MEKCVPIVLNMIFKDFYMALYTLEEIYLLLLFISFVRLVD